MSVVVRRTSFVFLLQDPLHLSLVTNRLRVFCTYCGLLLPDHGPTAPEEDVSLENDIDPEMKEIINVSRLLRLCVVLLRSVCFPVNLEM